MSWEIKKFDQIMDIKKGEPITKAESNLGPYPVILGGKEPAYYIDQYNHEGKAIVVSRSGASAGYVSYWDEPIFITDGFLIEPHNDMCFEFVFYLLRYYGKALRDLQNGSAIPHVTPKTIYNLKAPIPPLNTQERIVEVLLSYDRMIEANSKRISILEQIIEHIYKEWFVRFRFPGYIEKTMANGIPENWGYISVVDISAILQRGISPEYDDDGDLMVISQKCIRQSIMDIHEARRQTKGYKQELNLLDGDTVICSTGTGTLGRVGQVYGDYPGTTFDSHVTLVRAKASISKHFLFWSLKAREYWFMNMGIGSTNQQELYKKTIQNTKILIPELKIMMDFEAIVEPIHQEIAKLLRSKDILVRQRDLLLPRLMSGKLQVQ